MQPFNKIAIDYMYCDHVLIIQTYLLLQLCLSGQILKMSCSKPKGVFVALLFLST